MGVNDRGFATRADPAENPRGAPMPASPDDDRPHRDAKFQRRLNALSDQVNGMAARFRGRQREQWRGLVGDLLEEMLVSRAATEAFFADPDPNVRLGAMIIVALYWMPDPVKEDVYRHAALNDVDTRVRNAAWACLVHLYRGTADSKLSTELAGLVMDESNPVRFRTDSYVALAHVQGTKITDEAMRSILRATEQLPPELDLDWVKRFLPQNENRV
jgi:hypothetical protein